MRRLPLFLAFAVVGLVTASGCTVGSPQTAFGRGVTGTKTTDAGGMDGGTTIPTGDMAAPLTPPQLATYSQTSTWTTVPLHGKTSPPNSSVIITAMDGTLTSADVDGAGNFCANLTLQLNKTNTFQLKTHDNNTGDESASVSIQVVQSGEPPNGGQPQDAENVSLGGAGTAYQIGTTGTQPAPQVTDGDTNTWIEDYYEQTSNWYGGGETWPVPAVIVQLSAASSIDQIVAVFPSDCIGDGTLTLAYSAQSTPTTPAPGAAGWVVTPATKSADGSTWTASFSPATATFVAAWWANVNSSDPGGCGDDGLTYGLAELQGWTAAGVPQPPQTAPTCGL